MQAFGFWGFQYVSSVVARYALWRKFSGVLQFISLSERILNITKL